MSDSEDDRYERFIRLFVESERDVRCYIRSLTKSAGDVDDLMQNVALVCWNKFDQFQHDGGESSFLRWLFVIARIEVLRHRRKMARDRLVLSSGVVERLACFAESRAGKSQMERVALKQCLQELKPSEQQLVLSLYTKGDSVAKLAADTNQNSRRLYRKLNGLRKLLAKCVKIKTADLEASNE